MSCPAGHGASPRMGRPDFSRHLCRSHPNTARWTLRVPEPGQCVCETPMLREVRPCNPKVAYSHLRVEGVLSHYLLVKLVDMLGDVAYAVLSREVPRSEPVHLSLR